jgi:hypothetical protein
MLPLTLNLLTSTIVAPPSNASKWQMGFNSAFKGLISETFPDLLYGCWSVTVRKNTHWAFQSVVWRNLMIRSYVIMVLSSIMTMVKWMGMRWGKRHAWERRVCNILLRKLGTQRSLVRSRHRLEDVELNHREMGRQSVYWIHLAQHKDLWPALTIIVINFRILKNVVNSLTTFSRRTLVHGVSYLHLSHYLRSRVALTSI